MRFKSIFSNLFLFLIIFTLILVGSLWTFQLLFLPDYYENKKVETIKTSIVEIDEIIQKENFSEDALEKIVTTTERLNGRIIIYDLNGEIILQEGPQGMMRETRLSRDQVAQLKIEKNMVYKTNAVRGNSEFLAYLSLGIDNIYLVLTPFQAIEDAISITSGFYLLLFLGGIIIALILAYFFAGRISKPLIKLNKVASDIASLNFNSKWDGERSDEIGQLGNSLNKLSYNLEKALSDLQEELEKEKNLDKLRKNFVSRVSHELQTPIAIINGHIEALNDQIPQSDEEKNEYLKIVEKETNKMSKLIKDLLDLTQLESGTFRIKKHIINYSDLIEEKLNSFKILLKEKNIHIIKNYTSDNINIYGDEYRIDQVLNNFIQNAINNTSEEGKIEINIIEDKNYVKTEIINEGKNIPEDIIYHIWEPFFKGEERKGTGIGLAVVKSIINLHGGVTGVENLENGVKMYFSIPK